MRRSRARLRAALAEADGHGYLSRGFLARGLNHHARRRRQGAFANPVAADALDPVAIDRARAGADHGAGDRPAAAVELACDLGRRLGSRRCWARASRRRSMCWPGSSRSPPVSASCSARSCLMPAITSLVASVFVDEVADHVEREHYPAERPGVALPFGLAMTRRHQDRAADDPGLSDRAALRVLRRRRLPRLLHRDRLAVGPGIFRTRGDALPPARGSQGDAQGERRHRFSPPGLIIAAFVSIPIVNLATPLFGMAFMVHMHKRLSGPRPELIEPQAKDAACPVA